MTEEHKIKPYIQNQAKQFIDSMYNAKVFHEKLTRDDFQCFEDLLAYYLECFSNTAYKISEFNAKYKDK